MSSLAGCQRIPQSSFFIAVAVIVGVVGAPHLAIVQNVTSVAWPVPQGEQTPAVDLQLLIERAIVFCQDIG